MYNRVKKEKIEELKELAKVDLLKSIYLEMECQNLTEFAKKWDKKYSYISKSWIDNWGELSTF